MGSRSLIFHEVTTITDSSRVGRPLSSQDPVEDFASDEEAPHAAPRTPPHAGRLACGKSPDEPGTGGQAEATKVQQGDFDLEALDAANQEPPRNRRRRGTELADLEAKPSEPSEASEDEGQAEDGGALPEEPWERWSRRERELWERVRPRHLRREAHQVQGLRLPAAVLTRLLRLHPQMHSKSSEALEIINHSTVLLLQAVAKAAVRGKAPGKRVSFEDAKLWIMWARPSVRGSIGWVRRGHFQRHWVSFGGHDASTRSELAGAATGKASYAGYANRPLSTDAWRLTGLGLMGLCSNPLRMPLRMPLRWSSTDGSHPDDVPVSAAADAATSGTGSATSESWHRPLPGPRFMMPPLPVMGTVTVLNLAGDVVLSHPCTPGLSVAELRSKLPDPFMWELIWEGHPALRDEETAGQLGWSDAVTLSAVATLGGT
eukprot:g12015.t1